jgi:hypothetical protein
LRVRDALLQVAIQPPDLAAADYRMLRVEAGKEKLLKTRRVDALNFQINRAGRGLTAEHRRTVERAKLQLHKPSGRLA